MFDPLSERLRNCGDARSLAKCLLHNALKLSNACFGNVQFVRWEKGYLEIEAQSGFGDEFLNFFERVQFRDSSACARALRDRCSIVVEDITKDRLFAPCSEILHRANVRAVQSTPMISSSGAFVGVLSTHFPQVHRPTDIEMRNIARSAQLAANALIALRVKGRSSRDEVTSSLELLRQSQDTAERTNKLLSRSSVIG
ncbi:MAG: GAF domain-containing protein [Xanthobacteraceae bacterium]|jgi:GAF domain-containing protein